MGGGARAEGIEGMYCWGTPTLPYEDDADRGRGDVVPPELPTGSGA
jgi:hypothetical protein